MLRKNNGMSLVDRRTFLGESAGMVATGFGCFGSLEGLRAALAAAMTQQKPLLTEESLNAFIAEARSSRQREVMVKVAATDLDSFLNKHFQVHKECQRVLSGLSREQRARIGQAIQEGFTGRNELRVQIADEYLANVDLQNVPEPRIGIERTQTVGDDAQMTMIKIGP
jgi:hypothetical protein